MSFSRPPVDLLDEDLFDYHNFYAGRFFWPMNYSYERHFPVLPGVNRVVHNPPLPPADRVEMEEEIDVVGLEDGAVFQGAEPHREGGVGVLQGLFGQLHAWRGEGDGEEEMDAAGSDDVAEPHGGGGDGQDSSWGH